MASASANKMCRLKYSCEEVYERMDKGLCIFCDELDIPGHHDLKHKGIQIFIVDDDLACNDVEEVHQIQQAVKNPNPFVEPVKNSDALIEPLDCASVLQVLDSVSDVLMVHKVDSHVNEVEESSQQSTNSNDKIVAHQLFDQMPNACQKDLTVIESSNKEVFSFSHKDARVWEPGGLPTKMDHWDWLEKELKPYGESHMVATFLYSQMQMGKSNPADFKTSFDRKRSNKTLSLEDKQDDEHEQNQVIKLISSWKNRIWEPGGVLIEHNRWEEFEKCYKHGRLMRLMQELSSMWWLLSKSRELERFGACSFVDIKMWLDLCSREYKNQMLLLGYHGLEVQVLSCLQEFGEGSKMGTRIVLCWRKLASFLWFLHGKKLVYAGQKMQSMLVSDFKTWVPHFGYELRLAGTDPVLGLPWSSFENDMNRLWRGPEAVLSFNSEKMGLDWFFQRDLHKSCLDIRRMITLLCSSADYRKLNLWVDTNYCEIQPDQTHVKLQEMSCSLSEKSLVEFVGYKAHGRELLVMVVKQLTLAATKFHLKHKWRSRLLQSFSELKQRIIVSLWKSLGYLRKAHGSKYEGLVCALERKKLRTIEDDIDHLKKLLATMEGLAQKISCGLLCGNGKFHLKHKWKSRLIQALSGLQFGMGNIVLITSPVKVAYSVLGLEVFVENVVLFTGPDKLLFSNNHKLLHPETGFCSQFNDLDQLSTDYQGSPGLNYFTYLNFIWKQVLNCGCEAGHISSGFFSVGDIHGDETLSKRLLVLNEMSLLDNENDVDLIFKGYWFHNEPMIGTCFSLMENIESLKEHEQLEDAAKGVRSYESNIGHVEKSLTELSVYGVFHLQRPPELIELQGNPNFFTKVRVQWKEHPPDQFFSGSQWQEFNFSSLRTRMFRRGKYCDRIISNPGSHKPDFS